MSPIKINDIVQYIFAANAQDLLVTAVYGSDEEADVLCVYFDHEDQLVSVSYRAGELIKIDEPSFPSIKDRTFSMSQVLSIAEACLNKCAIHDHYMGEVRADAFNTWSKADKFMRASEDM